MARIGGEMSADVKLTPNTHRLTARHMLHMTQCFPHQPTSYIKGYLCVQYHRRLIPGGGVDVRNEISRRASWRAQITAEMRTIMLRLLSDLSAIYDLMDSGEWQKSGTWHDTSHTRY